MTTKLLILFIFCFAVVILLELFLRFIIMKNIKYPLTEQESKTLWRIRFLIWCPLVLVWLLIVLKIPQWIIITICALILIIEFICYSNFKWKR